MQDHAEPHQRLEEITLADDPGQAVAYAAADRAAAVGEFLRSPEATDSRGRAEIALAEFAECADGGADTIKLLTAVTRIVEEIWHDDPAATWEKAKKLLAGGYARHDVIHRLAG